MMKFDEEDLNSSHSNLLSDPNEIKKYEKELEELCILPILILPKSIKRGFSEIQCEKMGSLDVWNKKRRTICENGRSTKMTILGSLESSKKKVIKVIL